MQQCDICIVGNGAVGKAAALGFAQAGHQVVLVGPSAAGPELHAESAYDTRVFALNHPAHQLLSQIKVWDALDASRIAAVSGMAVAGDVAPDSAHLNFDAYGARVETLAWIVEDANLNQALNAALKFAPNVRIIDAAATKLEVDAQSALLKLQNGEQIRCALLIGADGRQSWVRGQADIDIAYRPYGQRAVVTNFHCELPHHGVAHQWFSPELGIIALLPLPGERVSLVWSAPDNLAEVLMRESLTQLAQRLFEFSKEKLGRLSPLQPEAVQAFPLALIRAKQIIAPRIALIGDAAHVVHPLAGHGMNLGFADVADLMRVLAAREKQRDAGDPVVLARYARARAEDILLMQLATDGLQRVFATDFEPLRLARNLGMQLLDRVPFLKRRLISHAMGSRSGS